MGRYFLIAGICVVVMSTNSVHADDAFDAFRAFCVTTHADGKAAIAEADKAGWERAPDGILDRISALGGMTDRQGRIHRTAAGSIVLVVNHGKVSPKDPFGGRACDIAVNGDRTNLWQPLAATVAAVPLDNAMSKTGPSFIWQSVNGKHVALRDDAPDVMTLFESGKLNILAIRRNIGADTSMLSLIVPSKTQ